MAQPNEISKQNDRRYSRQWGASVPEIEDFIDWCSQLCRTQQEEAVEKGSGTVFTVPRSCEKEEYLSTIRMFSSRMSP